MIIEQARDKSIQCPDGVMMKMSNTVKDVWVCPKRVAWALNEPKKSRF